MRLACCASRRKGTRVMALLKKLLLRLLCPHTRQTLPLYALSGRRKFRYTTTCLDCGKKTTTHRKPKGTVSGARSHRKRRTRVLAQSPKGAAKCIDNDDDRVGGH